MIPRKRLLIPGVIAGVGLIAIATMLKPNPQALDDYDNRRLVSVQPLVMQESAPQVIGYGRVAPKNEWQAVAEVSGRLIEKNEHLEPGRLLEKGTPLLQIDPLEYQLALAQAQANVSSTEIELDKLDQEFSNLQTTYKLEQQKLTLVEQEYKRQQDLLAKNLVAQSDVEAQKQTLIAQQKLVQDMSSNIKLMPDTRRVTEAQLNIAKAQLNDAQRKLDKTQLTLPFDARIGEVNVELDQVVGLNSVMLTAQKLGTVEVKAELSLDDLRALINSIGRFNSDGQLPSFESLGLSAHLKLQSFGDEFSWPAKVTRIADTVNPEQATIGVYLEVEQNFRELQLPSRPPLTKGMFLTAIIDGYPSPQFVIPEKALHGDKIYLLDEQQKLNIVPIKVLYRTANGVAIAGELERDQQLITNDLIPAIEGMGLRLMETQ
ncbi:efflux RND transporter periplasmic adaptor subunit [Paraferrimonas haliotis]|uniref:efflux RND transporter periplasmic adaptor subunit n=1 Tax=Paraferrimonas haliotis TaxID=2013866 RepID=UPI000BA996D1|nr:HlyD family efflux transporter periplasmic adaptor subunit [Paraferrimonas haliotis]